MPDNADELLPLQRFGYYPAVEQGLSFARQIVPPLIPGTATPSAPGTYDVPIYRGTGRSSNAGVYNEGNSAGVPIAGDAKYYAFNPQHAQRYGPNVETSSVRSVVKKPMLITDGEQWRALTKEAGWSTPNPSGSTPKEMKAKSDKLQKVIKDKGHDGIVVLWNDNTPYDVGPKGENLKLLRNVFDIPQVISFGKQK